MKKKRAKKETGARVAVQSRYRGRKYEWREGSRFKANANEIGIALEPLERADGYIDLDAGVREAGNPRSPLHSLPLDWDDVHAAHEHRKEQLRFVLRSLRFTDYRVKTPSPVFIVIPAQHGKVYMASIEVMKDKTKREYVLQRAYDEMLSWRERYHKLVEFADVFAVIDKIPPPGGSKPKGKRRKE